MSADDEQHGGDHYKKHGIQPWHIIDEYGLDFYEGTALEYLLRDKNDRLEDLKKCRHNIEKKIELLQGKNHEQHDEAIPVGACPRCAQLFYHGAELSQHRCDCD